MEFGLEGKEEQWGLAIITPLFPTWLSNTLV